MKCKLFGFLLLLMAGVLVLGGLGCGAPTQDFIVTSDKVQNHTHDLKVKGAAVDDPPAGGTSQWTTAVSIKEGDPAHVHTVKISQDDYEKLKAGEEITITSDSAYDHTHTFKIKVPAAK